MGAEEPRVTVVSVLVLPVRAGAADAVARAFAELEIFEHSRRSGGFRGGRLLRPIDDGEPFLVVAEWDDADAYRRWLANPVRERLRAGLEALVPGGELVGTVYEEELNG
jgi:heme-degrading monooxygenase HmoA